MKLHVASSNIRFDNPQDRDRGQGWNQRKKVLAQRIQAFNPLLLGTQEGRRPQLQDLQSLIGLNMADAHRPWLAERMYPSLFFHPSLTLKQSDDIWLSQTPRIPGSKSFNSTFPRLATWARFEWQQRLFVMANLHLDHQQPATRLEQIKVFTQEIKKVYRNLPLLVSGDFNEGPQGAVYQWVTEELSLVDPWTICRHPERSSHHKFNGDIRNGERIDWILTSRHFAPGNIFFDIHSQNQVFPSDHFPLFASLELTD